MIVVDFINLQRLQYKLKQMEKKADRREVIRKASREAARPLFAATKAATPKRTGILRASVKLRAARKSRVRVGVNVIIRAIDMNKAIRAGKVNKQRQWGWTHGKQPLAQWKAFYGSFVEMGTSHIRPRRFMKKTARQYKRQVQRELVRKALDMIVKNYGI